MSRIRNADEFRTAFQRARGDYDRIFRRQLAEVRAWYDVFPAERRPPDFDESLEHHVRCYVINAFLAGLNWRLDLKLEDGLPNLLPEVGLRSAASGTRRFLDYLGVEHATNNPPIIVEAKRPSSPDPAQECTGMSDELWPSSSASPRQERMAPTFYIRALSSTFGAGTGYDLTGC